MLQFIKFPKKGKLDVLLERYRTKSKILTNRYCFSTVLYVS